MLSWKHWMNPVIWWQAIEINWRRCMTRTAIYHLSMLSMLINMQLCQTTLWWGDQGSWWPLAVSSYTFKPKLRVIPCCEWPQWSPMHRGQGSIAVSGATQWINWDIFDTKHHPRWMKMNPGIMVWGHRFTLPACAMAIVHCGSSLSIQAWEKATWNNVTPHRLEGLSIYPCPWTSLGYDCPEIETDCFNHKLYLLFQCRHGVSTNWTLTTIHQTHPVRPKPPSAFRLFYTAGFLVTQGLRKKVQHSSRKRSHSWPPRWRQS